MYVFFSYSLFYTETQHKPSETQWFNISIFLETNIETLNFMKKQYNASFLINQFQAQESNCYKLSTLNCAELKPVFVTLLTSYYITIIGALHLYESVDDEALNNNTTFQTETLMILYLLY